MWDDEEERRYREWLREEQQKVEGSAEWSEFGAEEAYRARLREEAASREDEPIHWEDEKEKEFRRRYLLMR